MTYPIKQGSLSPPLEAQLTADGQPINLNGVTVEFCMGAHVRGPMEIVDAAEGRVRYHWQLGDTDRPGVWNAEFVVTTITGEPQRVPNSGYVTIEVERAVCGRDCE